MKIIVGCHLKAFRVLNKSNLYDERKHNNNKNKNQNNNHDNNNKHNNKDNKLSKR